MTVDQNERKKRTKQFAPRVMTLVAALPQNAVGREIRSQLVQYGTFVGAIYRVARRGR